MAQILNFPGSIHKSFANLSLAELRLYAEGLGKLSQERDGDTFCCEIEVAPGDIACVAWRREAGVTPYDAEKRVLLRAISHAEILTQDRDQNSF